MRLFLIIMTLFLTICDYIFRGDFKSCSVALFIVKAMVQCDLISHYTVVTFSCKIATIAHNIKYI